MDTADMHTVQKAAVDSGGGGGQKYLDLQQPTGQSPHLRQSCNHPEAKEARFIGHFVSVYSSKAPPFTRESARWSADPENIKKYLANGNKMDDVIGKDVETELLKLPEEERLHNILTPSHSSLHSRVNSTKTVHSPNVTEQSSKKEGQSLTFIDFGVLFLSRLGLLTCDPVILTSRFGCDFQSHV